MPWETQLIPFLIAGNTTIINQYGQLLMYNGKPAANNLILAESPIDFTDPYGNQGFAGLQVYKPFSAGRYQLLLFSQSSNAIILYSNLTGQNSWGSGTAITFPSTTALGILADSITHAAITGGVVPVFNTGIIQLKTNAAFSTSFDVTTALTEWANAQGTLNIQNIAGSSAGVQWPGAVPTSLIDTTTNTVGNVATAGAVTKSWSVPASDGVSGTKYVIEADIKMNSGQTVFETFTIGAIINGTFVALATLGAAFNGSPLNAPFYIPCRLSLVVDDIGTNTPHISLDADLSQTNVNRLSTTTCEMSGVSDTQTWNKTLTNTFAIGVQFGGTGGSLQSALTTASELIRKGP